MRNVPTPLLDHLRGATTTTALYWRVEPDGKPAEGYTNHDEDLLIDGLVYSSVANLLPTAIPASIGLSIDAVEVTTLLPGRDASGVEIPFPGVTPRRLATAHYARARVRIFVVNWSVAETQPPPLLSGRLGKPKMQGLKCTFELLPLSSIVNEPIGRVTCPTCPYARFGRGHCRNEWGLNDGPDIAEHTDAGAVASVASRHTLTLSGITRPTGWADMGILRFTSGANAGVEREVKTWLSSGVVQLALDLPFLPMAGDTVELEEGCQRTWQACQSKNNTANFGGHPFLPGQSKFQKRYEF